MRRKANPALPIVTLMSIFGVMICAASTSAQSPPADGGTVAQPAPATPPVPVKATGAAAWQQVDGNTVVAKSKDGSYTEFYAPDGTVKHVDRDGAATGTWALQGEKVCFEFPDEDDRNCVSVEVSGQTGVFIDEDAARDTFDLLPGNAKNL